MPTEDELVWCIGPPLWASLKKLTGTQALADQAPLLYREWFADIGLFENEAFQAAHVYRNQQARRLRRTHRRSLRFETLFRAVFGSELDGTRIEKTDLLRYGLETANVDPRQAVMIGDRGHDMIGARNNEMTAIGVLYGYGSRDELIDAGAHCICAAPHELVEHAA